MNRTRDLRFRKRFPAPRAPAVSRNIRQLARLRMARLAPEVVEEWWRGVLRVGWWNGPFDQSGPTETNEAPMTEARQAMPFRAEKASAARASEPYQRLRLDNTGRESDLP